MDYNDKYRELFKMLKTNKYENFIKSLNEIDNNDIIFDINVRDEQENYFMTYAVVLNEIKLVDALLEKDAKIDITNKNNESLLIVAINYSYYDILERLLIKNKKSIGLSITDMRDKNMKTALLYAIEIKNFKAIDLLLKYGSNVNSTDKIGQNALHYAIKTRSMEICEMILQHIADVNAKINTGETALHIATNLQLINITKLLIKNNANVNIQDHSHEIAPLHYSVLLNNKEISALLLKNGAEPNTQDVHGNTPLHYSIFENNFETFVMLTKSNITKNVISFNVWNIYGEIPFHLVLKNNVDHIHDYIEIMLEKSNLTIQDNEGNTCLYYLISMNLWKDYKNYLIKKRLDIFTLNAKNEYPIDLIEKDDFDEFIDMIIESYMNRLKNASELWYEEWENICSKTFESIDESEKKLLDLKKNDGDFEKICKENVRNKLLKLINDMRSNKDIQCHVKSFPTKKSYVCINISNIKNSPYCTFTGSTLDILMGLIFLLKKYKDVCSTLSKNYSSNKELCDFYRSIGIIMNNKCEFLNFEIVWVRQRLYLMEGFYDMFKKCINSNVKYIIIPLGIELKEGNHAGYLIYDVKKKEIERFEPHGATTPVGFYYNPNLLDELLEARFKSIDQDITYIKPTEYIPKIGFQIFDIGEQKKKKIGDPLGFCALWSIWYVDMRLTYRELSRKKIVDILINTIKSKNISFKNMIRNYGTDIIKIRDNILKKSEMTIDDWLNDQYTDIQVNSVLDELTKEIVNLTMSRR